MMNNSTILGFESDVKNTSLNHTENLQNREPQNGYDTQLYGIDNGHFYSIHITAIVCILCGFVCCLIAIISSFRRRDYKEFFTKWPKSDRFIIYMAICDGMFNISHSLDHSTIVITKDHVRPLELCQFYGFNNAMFISAQMLLVNVVAINIFMLMHFNKNIDFGNRDWRLLLYIFGTSFSVCVVVLATNSFGPSDIACYFDRINGEFTMWFTSVPLLVILAVNIALYIVTWNKLRKHAAAMKQTNSSATTLATSRTARNMSFFVAAFVIQWWPMAVYVVWHKVDYNSIHIALYYLCVIFSNLGGCLNLIVYHLIRFKSTKSSTSNKPKEQEGDSKPKDVDE